MKQYRNVLVQYEGGGYDGCIWEWNFAFFDGEGNHHTIYASGYKGEESEQGIRDLLDNDEDARRGPHVFDLTVQNDIDELMGADNLAADHIIGIARWLEEHVGFDLPIRCDECKKYVDVLDITATGLYKAGGIVYFNEHKFCSDCYHAGRCDGCNEYVGPDELSTIEDEGNFCKNWCYDEKRKELAP